MYNKNQIYDDAQFINEQTLSFYANTNEEVLTLPVKGIVVEFPGLGGSSCLGGNIDMGAYNIYWTERFGEKGIIVTYMFPGPWSWGNKGAVRMADAVISALIKKYNLPDDIPVAVCGGSMGGLGSLMFSIGTKHNLKGVAAACPCTDVIKSLDCSPDFPRTYVSAVASYDKPLDVALRTISPIHRINNFPSVPYFICSDGEDNLFAEADCDLFVERLKAKGHDVEYYQQPGKLHGEFLPEVRERLHVFLEECILKG